MYAKRAHGPDACGDVDGEVAAKTRVARFVTHGLTPRSRLIWAACIINNALGSAPPTTSKTPPSPVPACPPLTSRPLTGQACAQRAPVLPRLALFALMHARTRTHARTHTHTHTHTALDELRLDYAVSWPLNLIINPPSLELYNQILIFLLQVRFSRAAAA